MSVTEEPTKDSKEWRKWWKSLSDKERREHVARGGRAKWDSMNPGKRKAHIRKMVLARKKKALDKKLAT